MNAQEFVANWAAEKASMLETYFERAPSEHPQTDVGLKIAAMGLTEDQLEQLRAVVDGILVDTMYTLLRGLDGSASIGGVQHTYRILDEEGRVISQGGELEVEAYEQFHEAPRAAAR
ncbi:hypothetical protein [Roseateles chitinivorans]|uniref:hypothetical protein n=1 Tax=Roseateles chitinivorans TaxID=2917965 RepID=UPI003D672E4B